MNFIPVAGDGSPEPKSSMNFALVVSNTFEPASSHELFTQWGNPLLLTKKRSGLLFFSSFSSARSPGDSLPMNEAENCVSVCVCRGYHAVKGATHLARCASRRACLHFTDSFSQQIPMPDMFQEQNMLRGIGETADWNPVDRACNKRLCPKIGQQRDKEGKQL